MINHQLDLYLNWLIGLVIDEEHSNYTELCGYLMSVDFRWSVPMDENRASDGVHLRLTFMDQTGYSFDNLDAPCTVLEMMIALALKVSENVLWDGTNNWTPFIFWTMVENLDLLCYDNNYFWKMHGRIGQDLEAKIDNFLDRKYDKNGKGGLFLPTQKNFAIPKKWDQMEVWYQCAEWLNENFV
jgi:hypothetical protein